MLKKFISKDGFLEIVEGIRFTGDNIAEIEELISKEDGTCIITPEQRRLVNKASFVLFNEWGSYGTAQYFVVGDIITSSLEVLNASDEVYLDYTEELYDSLKKEKEYQENKERLEMEAYYKAHPKELGKITSITGYVAGKANYLTKKFGE